VITTFYSYGGGVGRSLAVAVTASVLARRGHRVLVADFSLQSPAVLRYLRSLHLGRGIGDLLVGGSTFAGWRECLFRVSFSDNHAIDVLPAGTHPAAVDWGRLRTDEALVVSIEDMRDEWRRDYDVVLVDSEAGTGEIAGVCTIQLPDVIVALAGPSGLNITGVADVLARAQRARAAFPFDRYPAAVVPILSGVDSMSVVDRWRSAYREAFGGFLESWLPSDIPADRVLDRLALLRVTEPGSAGGRYVWAAPAIAPNRDPLEALASLLESRLSTVEEVLASTSARPDPPPMRDAPARIEEEPVEPELRHVVIVGGGALAERVIEDLVGLYPVRVTAIRALGADPWTDRVRDLFEVDVIDDADDERLRAVLASATAVGMFAQADVGLRPDVERLVAGLDRRIRVVTDIGPRPVHWDSSTGSQQVGLLPAEIAEPVFVAAALNEIAVPVLLDEQPFVLRARSSVAPADVVAEVGSLAPATSGGRLPGDADLVLARARATPPPRRRRPSLVREIRIDTSSARPAFGYPLGLAVLVLGIIPVVVLSRHRLLTLALLGVGGLLAVVLADVTVRMVRAWRTGVRAALSRASNHVIVVGLDGLGMRVVRELVDRGVDVVAINRDGGFSGILAAARGGVPMVVGDPTTAAVLAAARLTRSRAVVVLDGRGAQETARNAQAVGRRTVVRLDDEGTTEQVPFTLAYSVAALAVPAFTAALMGGRVLATVADGGDVLLVAEVEVQPGSALEHRRGGDVDRPQETRLIAIRPAPGADPLWSPSADRRLRSGDRLVVAATRTGLARLIVEAAQPADRQFRSLPSVLETLDLSRASGADGPGATVDPFDGQAR
jgi:Trk K+ transport system NAD-binding subunit/cellulose biosynthesis protein BcsQ